MFFGFLWLISKILCDISINIKETPYAYSSPAQ